MTPFVVADVIKSVRDLPALPAVVIDLLGSMDQEGAGARLLAHKLSQDQALTAKTLRLANSSFYGMQHKVTTIQQAIAILGFNSVRTLVTAAAVTGSFPTSGPGVIDFSAFWRHSFASALCAKALAKCLHADQDQAFMVGLLHDIGRLVMVTRFPELYEKVIARRAEQDCFLFEAERAVFSVDHAMVGQALAVHWKFPVPMQKAIADHHSVDAQVIDSLTFVAHLADAITHALDLSGVDDDLVPSISGAASNWLNMNTDTMTQVFCETEAQFEEACQILGT